MNFKEFHFSEMAVVSARYEKGAFSKKDDWKYNRSDARLFRLIKSNINSQHMSLWQNFSNYFLISKDNEYLGHVQFDLKNKVAYINGSSSNIERGFYNIIYTAILGLTDIEEIRSDNDLSVNAIKAYENLSKSHKLTVKVFDGSEYSEFTRENLLKNSRNIVSISAHEILKESYQKFFKRIEQNEPYYKLFNEYNKDIDSLILYGESISEMEY